MRRFQNLLHSLTPLLKRMFQTFSRITHLFVLMGQKLFVRIPMLLRFVRRELTLKRLAIFFAISFAFWVTVSLMLAAAAHSYGQQDQAASADVLIVLGSGLRRDGSPGDALWRRSIRAAEVWSQGLAPVILCTGGQSAGQRRSEANACKEVLIENGVPASAIYLEEYSRSTEENAINSKMMMQANDWNQAILITDAFHMLRAHWIFDSYDIAHFSSPVPSERVRRGWYTWLLGREVVAMQWQAFKTVFNLPITAVPIA